MKISIILILLLTALYANCQTDSIWIEGDNVCMNKEKAVQFAKMKDSLSFLESELELRQNLLKDCGVLILAGQETIQGVQGEVEYLLEKIIELEGKLGLEQEKRQLKDVELQSIMFINEKVQKERRKFKVQRDVLIGTGVSLGVTVIILIIINAI